MDARNQLSARRRADERGSKNPQEGYVIHFLALDGTVATLKKKVSDDTCQLTVEAHDRQATRRVAAKLARDPDSPELAQIIAEIKAALAHPSAGRPAH
jgi:hypothetical protein